MQEEGWMVTEGKGREEEEEEEETSQGKRGRKTKFAKTDTSIPDIFSNMCYINTRES
jgi:hypothetical protein